MKIKKILALAICTVAVLTALSGCGTNNDTKKVIDIEATTKTIVDETKFLGEVVKMTDENIEILYSAYDNEIIGGVAVYSCASKATAEEVAIFKAKDAASVAKVEEIVKKRVEDLKKEYESYVPAEMAKLNSPYIATKDEYVVLVIADDTSVGKSTFEKAFK